MTIYQHVETAHIACVLKLEANFIDKFNMLKINENYTFSVDLSGKLSPGDDQETNGCRYFLVGCYDLPVTHDGASLLPMLGRDEAEDQPLPSLGEEVEGMAQHEAGDEQLLPEENERMEEDVEEKMSRRRSRCTTPHGHRLHGGSGKECGAETTHFC